MVKFNLITISLILTFIYIPEQYSSRGSDTTSIWVAYSTVIFIIDTIDYVTGIGNYVRICRTCSKINKKLIFQVMCRKKLGVV